MKILYAVKAGDDHWRVLEAATLKAVKDALLKAGAGAKKDVRSAVKVAGFAKTTGAAASAGQNFEKSFRTDVFPRKRSALAYRPVLAIVAKARFAEAFEDGATAAGKPYLAVPLPAARDLSLDRSWVDRGAGKRFSKRSDIKAAQDQYGPLKRVPSKSGYLLAAPAKKVAGKTRVQPLAGRTYVPLFAMVKQVRIAKRYSLKAILARWHNRLPGLVADELDKI